MSELKLTKEGQEILDEIVAKRPPIVASRRAPKYHQMLDFLITKYGLEEANRELVIEAIKMVESGAITSTFMRWEDPARFQRQLVDANSDLEAYYSLPIEVKRWPRPSEPPEKSPSEMKVLAFNSSPRKRGNTGALLTAAARGAREAGAQVTEYWLPRMKIGYCSGCRKCHGVKLPNYCTLKDDMTALYPEIIAADAIIVAFPIYSARECAQMATFIDRWDCLGRMEKPKRGMVISTWGLPVIDAYDYVIEYAIVKFNAHNLRTVEAISGSGFEGKLHGLDDQRQGMVLRHPEQVQKAYLAGKGLVTE